MANYFADTLKVKSVYGLDDSGAYGIGIATAFEAQAKKRGIEVLGHDRLDPKAADYTPVLTKIKALGAQSIYYGGDAQAGVKLAKQAYDLVPNLIKAGGDGMYGPSILQGAGFPAADGWYATVACPHMMEDADTAALGEALHRQERPAAVRLLDHRLRRGAGGDRRDRACGEVGQAG